MYGQHIRQPQYKQLKVEGHLRVCRNGEFRIFPLLQMRSQDSNLKRSYETRFKKQETFHCKAAIYSLYNF